MQDRHQSRVNGLLVVATALFALFALSLALGANVGRAASSPGAAGSSADWPLPTGTINWWPTWPPEGSRTPQPWPTWPPEGSRTPHPWPTWPPEGSRTPHPWPTWPPEGSRTPPPWPTENEGTRTPHPWPTEVEGTRTPHPWPTENEGTRTPHPWPTEVEGTRTPHPWPTEIEGTRTPHPWPTENEGTRTPHPFPTENEGTRTPHPVPTGTITPCPPPQMALRPRVQFGHGAPGTDVTYQDALLNHFSQATTVDLSGDSFSGWNVSVVPAQVIAQPNVSNTLAISVSIPVSPSHPLDVERVIAATVSGPPMSTTAYLVTFAGEHPFSDVGAGHWANDSVQYLVGQHVIAGYADGSFRPNAYVTRAQFAKMLVGATGWSLQAPAQATFADVPSGSWAYSFIETAAAHGVMSGYADGTFRPDALVTRAQLAKMIALALGWAHHCGPHRVFSDVGPTDWFYDYADLASSAEVMSGYADGTFQPYALATRAQVAKILTLSLFSSPTD